LNYGFVLAISELKFVLHNVRFPVGSLAVRQACDALAHDPQIEECPVTSKVTDGVLELFISAVRGEAVEITNENVEGLSALCAEFEFRSLSHRLEVFKTAPAFQLTQLEGRFAKLAAEVSALRTPALTQLQNDLKNLKDSTEPLQNDVTVLKRKTELLQNGVIATLQSEVGTLQSSQQSVVPALTQLQADLKNLKDSTEPLQNQMTILK
jgi:TolA-binding protein